MAVAGWKSVDSVPQLVEDYMEKKIKIDEFITHHFALSEINDAFSVLHRGERCVSQICLAPLSYPHKYNSFLFSLRSVIHFA